MLKFITILITLTACLYLGVTQFYAEAKGRLETLLPKEGVSSVRQVETPANDVLPEASGADPDWTDYGVIVSRNIFQANVENTALSEKQFDLDALEETQLKLILQGTVVGTDKDARAIIVDGRTKHQDLYRVGDLVQNARIYQIKRGKIVLEHKGKREILVLKERKSSNSSPRLSQLPKGPPSHSIVDRRQSASRNITPVAKPKRRIVLKQQQHSLSSHTEQGSELPVTLQPSQEALNEAFERDFPEVGIEFVQGLEAMAEGEEEPALGGQSQ